ncbi:SPAG4 protein, partial [Galbula dea]|nr:SPAG4 protein [Galbula dea]
LTPTFIALAFYFQPDTSSEYCWFFQDSWIEVLIRLPTPVQLANITIQHALKIAPPLGTFSSTLTDFIVFGLDEEGNKETLLGAFTYDIQKEPTHTFHLSCVSPRAFTVLKLIIWSSWGESGYFCIYQVQVHGK